MFRACALLVALFLAAPLPGLAETIYLVPDDNANWRPSNLFAFLRPQHNFGDRFINITTTPPGAMLDLFYVRSNFQKRYEQTDAPAHVVLPRRTKAGPRDAVTIRAFLEGYRQKQVSVRVAASEDAVHIDLEPLPNTLEAVAHRYFAGRGELVFLTKEALNVRVQALDTGFRVILDETAKSTEAAATLERIRSPLIEDAETLQLGEDLLVRVGLPAHLVDGVDLRSRPSRDDLRDLYAYTVDIVPSTGVAEGVQRARAALASLSTAAVGSCALRFDASLRGSLDRAELSRALAPRGAFTDKYLRAAMKRLGEISPGARIRMTDGSRLNPQNPIELSAAMSQPAEAEGFLSVLRSFVRKLEPQASRRATLRGLVAPESDAASFEEVVTAAEAAERSCLASR
ncbi:MAG: hypothetical protein ACR2PQ_04505 [Myxococcota bacterium]